MYRYTLSCIFGTLLSLSCSSTGAVAVIQATASSFSRNVTTLYLDPFVRLPALGALIQLGERSYSSNERTTIEINLSETCCYALIGCPLMSPSGSELRQRSFSVKKAKEQNETSKMVTSDRLLNTSSHSFGQVRKRSLRIQFVSC